MKAPPISSSSRSHQVEVEFQIASLHPAYPAPALVQAIDRSLNQLSADLARRYGATRVVLKRRKTLPIDPMSVVLTVIVLVGTEVAKVLAQRIADDVFDWVKRRHRQATVSQRRVGTRTGKRKAGAAGQIGTR